MSEYFPQPTILGERVRVELDLSNHSRKADSKNETGVDTSKFAKKVDLANLKSNLSNLKSKVDKLDIDKLVPVLVGITKTKGSSKN